MFWQDIKKFPEFHGTTEPTSDTHPVTSPPTTLHAHSKYSTAAIMLRKLKVIYEIHTSLQRLVHGKLLLKQGIKVGMF